MQRFGSGGVLANARMQVQTGELACEQSGLEFAGWLQEPGCAVDFLLDSHVQHAGVCWDMRMLGCVCVGLWVCWCCDVDVRSWREPGVRALAWREPGVSLA